MCNCIVREQGKEAERLWCPIPNSNLPNIRKQPRCTGGGGGNSPHESEEPPSYMEESPKWREFPGITPPSLTWGGRRPGTPLSKKRLGFSTPAWESSFPSFKALFITLWYHEDIINNKIDLKWQKSILKNIPQVSHFPTCSDKTMLFLCK